LKNKRYFKVLRENLTSVGLLGAPRKQYYPGLWNIPNEPISNHPRKGGGIWVTPTKASARSFQKYVFNKYGIRTRIFACKIGKVLYYTSCRVKTIGIFFTEQDEIVK